MKNDSGMKTKIQPGNDIPGKKGLTLPPTNIDLDMPPVTTPKKKEKRSDKSPE